MLAMTFGLKRNEDRERKTHREREERERSVQAWPPLP